MVISVVFTLLSGRSTRVRVRDTDSVATTIGLICLEWGDLFDLDGVVSGICLLSGQAMQMGAKLAEYGIAEDDVIMLVVCSEPNESSIWIEPNESSIWIDPTDAAQEFFDTLQNPDAAFDAMPYLLRAVQHKNSWVRALASQALDKITGHGAEDGVGKRGTAAGNTLEDDQPDARASFVETLDEKHSAADETVSEQIIVELYDQAYEVRSRAAIALSRMSPAFLPRAIIVDVLARLDPREEAHGLLLQLALSLCQQDIDAIDQTVAKAVVHSIWCSRSEDVIRSAVKAFPRSMITLELNIFQVRYLVRRALSIVPQVVVECRLHELLDLGHDLEHPAEPAASMPVSSDYQNAKLPGFGFVSTDASFSSCEEDDSLESRLGDGVPEALCACPWFGTASTSSDGSETELQADCS